MSPESDSVLPFFDQQNQLLGRNFCKTIKKHHFELKNWINAINIKFLTAAKKRMSKAWIHLTPTESTLA